MTTFHHNSITDITKVCPFKPLKHFYIISQLEYSYILLHVVICTIQDLSPHLPIHHFLLDLTRMDKESTYYPKACNIPKLMVKVVTLNYLKHKTDKSYALNPTTKGTYPVHILQQEDTDTDLGSDGNDSIYKNHFFDKTDVHTSHRIHCSDLSTGLNPLRCVGGVCRHYRMDGSKVASWKRAQMSPPAELIVDKV